MEITIIIPFLNEREEVKNTLLSIQSTTKAKIPVILINDASDDGYDYESIARQFDCKYVKHEKRIGSGASKEEGIGLCQTTYFLVLDAHMRFYQQGWDQVLLSHLEKNPRSLLCCQTKALLKDKSNQVIEEKEHKVRCGARISFDTKHLFRASWIHTALAHASTLVDIPCVLGAAYACEKKYWQYLNGFKGLITYGSEEELISIKVWLEGGRCILINDLVVGHIYRKAFPYIVPHADAVYNKL